MAATAVVEPQATQASQVALTPPSLFPVEKMLESLLVSPRQPLTPRLEARTHFSDTLAHHVLSEEVVRQVERSHFFPASANTFSSDNSSDFNNNGGNSGSY